MLQQRTGLVYACQGQGVVGEGSEPLDGEEKEPLVVAKCGLPPQTTGPHWVSHPGHNLCLTGICCLHDVLLADRRDPSSFLQSYADNMLCCQLDFFESCCVENSIAHAKR